LGARVEQQIDLFVRGPALERLFQLPAESVLTNKVVIEIEGVSYPTFYVMQGETIASVAIEATGVGGYGGDIVMLFGVDLTDDSFLGMEVVSHSETPGLGALIVEPPFRSQWQGLSATETVALSRDGGAVDALTGATFTSGAAMDGTNRVVNLIASHRDEFIRAITEQRSATGEETG
ncbi:MAG: FMN-binding protein, partial [Gemmatimonadota bacterium]